MLHNVPATADTIQCIAQLNEKGLPIAPIIRINVNGKPTL